MKKLPEKDRSQYYHRCYKAVDGLWFVKAEEKYGFDDALEIDCRVWKVMPKIQARFLKEKLGKDTGLEDLADCLSQKLLLDGFEFKTLKKQKGGKTEGMEFIISACPWHDILIRSDRGHLSDRIGGVICGQEYDVWASLFGDDIVFSFGNTRICRGDQQCVLSFCLSENPMIPGQ
jgi:hypothetical protein